MKNDLEKLIQGIGATAEMTRLYFDNYVRVGFTPQQAFTLAKDITIAQMQIAAISGQQKAGDDE